MMRSVAFTTMGCSRSVCNHPFLLCMLCFLIYMYRLSPFMFSLLVSASPVFVCTAVLLGAILRFGQPNIPENEVEEKAKHADTSVKSGESEQNGQYSAEREVEKRRGKSEWAPKGTSLPESKASEICRDRNSDVVVASSAKQGTKKGGIHRASRNIGKTRHKKRRGWNEEIINNGEFTQSGYASNQTVYENLDSDFEKSEAESIDFESVNMDTPGSGWQKVENQDDEGEQEDDMSDSGSEESDSSSPGASMGDIVPMLDELHPLLDEVDIQPIQISRRGSQAASELSRQTSISGNESDVETIDDSEAMDDDIEDDDAEGDKEDQSKAVIMWTEEDQKNLQDLGSSEIERNQKLEILMLRRRERKFTSMVAEMNLIDLESSNPPLNIAPIVARHNPFDVPNDSSQVPGSAPSTLLPKRNPFDSPCESTKEKMDVNVMGGPEQLKMLQSKEPMSKRQRFGVGMSNFEHNRQNTKLRPYFVPEESGFPLFPQQSSEMSDSRLSSLPETASVSSAEDMEGQKLEEEEDNPKELEVISSTAESTENRLSGDQIEDNPKEIKVVSSTTKVTEEEPVCKRETLEDDESRVLEVISEDVGHGSQSSEEQSTSDLAQNDKKIPPPADDDHLGRGSAAQNSEAIKQNSSKDLKSSSEASKRVLNGTSEDISVLDERGDEDDDLDISRQTSAQSILTSSPPDEVPHKEPVYDSSPPAVEPSNSFCMHSVPELDLLPGIIKRTVSFAERDSDWETTSHVDINENEDLLPGIIKRVVEKGNSDNAEKLARPSMFRSDRKETSHVDVNEHEDGNNIPDSSEADWRPEGHAVSSSDVHSHSLVESSDDKRPRQSADNKHQIILQRDNLAQVRVSLSGSQTTSEKTAPSRDCKDEVKEVASDQISTPSAAGSTTVFYNTESQDPNTERIEEVQVPNTPVDSSDKMSSLPNLNIPNIHELIETSSIVDSPYTPDNAVPNSAGLRLNLQTIAEETNESKEMSELDDDDSDHPWASRPNAFEKYMDSTGDANPMNVGNGKTETDRLSGAAK